MPDRVTRQPAADTAPRKENIETQRTVLLLNAQADRMRIELAQLRLSLAGAQRELSANRSAQLREANEKLALAAVHAESIAEAALASLEARSRTAHRNRRTDTPDRPIVSGHSPVIAVTPEEFEVQRAQQSLQMRQLREANEQLVLGALSTQEIHERAESRYQQQVRFIAIVAHELRNPLNPIRNAAALLTRTRGNEALLDKLQGIIARQVVHMTRLIDDLLDGSKASVGKLRLQCASVNLLEVLDIAMDACRPGMLARHQHLATDLPPGPLHLQADPFRMAQVFSNLLDNASKYTPEGGSINLSLAMESDAVVLTVADDGYGITPNALERIFDLFEQDEMALPLQIGGLGIGLAVVRDLVQAHGGSVVAESAGVGFGSRFVVRLPLADPGRFPAPVSGTT